ncbi:MAG: putative Ig domain-containing protein [Acidimicrobiia bacterium]|nr:putative Ig domain-containing protein [Acidimicrobiia bacterium]
MPSTGETLIATVGANVDSYTDTQTAPGTTYSYEVTAVNLQFGESTRTGPAQATTAADDPTDAGWWAYEDQAGTAAGDTTAWRRSATLQGGAAWNPTGKIAGAVTLDGLDDRVDLDPGVLDGAGDISFATWFRTTKTGTQTIISGANPGNDNEYAISFVDDTTLRFYSGANPNAGATWQLPRSIADGEWHHLVVRRINGPSHVWAYIDGISVGGWLITIPMVPVEIDGLVLGQDQDGVLSGFQSAEAFEGDLDETRLFTRVLTQTEIDALSGRDLTEPDAPPSLSASSVGHDIDLTWAPATDPESGIATYRIGRDDGAGGPITRLTEVPGTATSYRDTAVAGSTTYTYHVTAINGGDLEGPASPGASATTPSADPSLLGWWPLDDGSGGTAVDATPNARHGILFNGPTWAGSGEIAGTLTFDGADDRVDFDHTILDGATDLTVAMWVRTTDTGIQALISGANVGNDAEYEWFLLSNPDLRLRFYTGEQNVTYVWWPTPTVADGEWHHFTVLRDDANDIAELFIDGASQGTRSAVLNQLQLDPGGLVLAQDQDVVGGGFDPDQAFNGSLDEVRIYDRLLSADEIGVLAGLPPAPPTNATPALDPIAPQSVDELSTVSFTATATDPDPGQALTFSLQGSVPDGASIDPNGGTFTWTPTEAQGPGAFTFDVVVTDDGTPAMWDSEAVTVTVGEVDTSPVLTPIGDRTVPESAEHSFTANATDADLPAQDFSYGLGPGAPSGASIDPTSGLFTWTPSEAEGPGTFPIEVVASDGTAALPATETIVITVTEVDTVPVLDPIGNMTGTEGNEITFTASASDADLPAQALTFSIVGAPAGASIHPTSGSFTWTPTEGQSPGAYTFEVRVTDTTDLFAAEQITITVTDTNSAPEIADITPITADELTQVTFTANASDPDLPAQNITYSLGAGAPPSASIDPLLGLFTWTPSEAEGPNTYTIEVIATDDGTPPMSGSTTVSITVAEANAAPSLDVIDDQTISEGGLLSFDASATDSDRPAQAISYSLAPGAPSGAAIDVSTGAFTWQTSEADGPGSYDITVIAADDGPGNLENAQTFTVTVTEDNTAPSLTPIADRLIPEGSALEFTVSATDADVPAQVITYGLGAGAPTGAVIDALTGDFSWTPTEAQGPGIFGITVIAKDNGPGNLEDSRTFTVTVTEVNAAPTLTTAGDLSGDEQSLITFTASATDVDEPGQQLTFGLSGQPAGASIEPSTGEFTWTPTEAQGPAAYTFDVIVSDGDLTDSEPITVTVAETYQAPVADAGLDQSTTVGTLVTLDGSGSGDADVPAQPLAFSWSFQSRPAGSTSTLTDPGAHAPSFTPDVAGSYVVLLTVDDGVDIATDTVTVTVSAVATATEVAVSETTTFGSVIGGDLTATYAVGGATEIIEEEVTSGNPRTRVSRLDHRWTFDIVSGDTSTIAVSATASSSDGDEFVFAYSVDGGQNYAEIVRINDGVTGGEATLPPGTSGQVIVRVTDTDRQAGNSNADAVEVDSIVITTTNPGPSLPEVTVLASDPAADESGDPGAFTFQRDDSSSSITVGYTVGGTADSGVDYGPLSGVVDFPAGVSQVVVDVVPVDDAVFDEGDEIVSVTVTPGTGYDVGTESIAVVTIADNDVSGGGGGQYLVSSEQTAYGDITSGDHTSTWVTGEFESITEEWYAGQNRTRLEHTWTITGVTGTSATLTIDDTSNGEAFVFEVSLDGGTSWNAEPSGEFALGGATTVLIRVTDTNRNKGDTIRDTVYVDRILLIAN